MRYLRMLTNAAIGGALASAYLIVLVLHLNPQFPLSADALARLAIALGLAYGVNTAVGFYALMVLRQLLAADVLSPGWASVRLLSSLATLAAVGGATLMWLNLRSFTSVLAPDTVTRMINAAMMLTASAVVFLLIALSRIGRLRGRGTAWLLVTTMVLSVVAPIAARGWGVAGLLSPVSSAPVAALQSARSGGRVVLLMIEGAPLDVISPAVAQGRLPNFGRLLDGGALLHLATLRPTQAEPVWSAAATGRVPVASGVRAAALYRVRATDPPLSLLPDYCFAQALVRFRFLAETPHDSRSFAARPQWRILSDLDLPIVVVGWPVTHSAPSVNGVIVSDVFHLLNDTELDLEDTGAVFPRSLVPLVRRAVATPSIPDPVALLSRIAGTRVASTHTGRDSAPIVADRMYYLGLPVARDMEGFARPDIFAAAFTARRPITFIPATAGDNPVSGTNCSFALSGVDWH